MDCSPPGSFVHGILQARIMEWVAIPFSRGTSWPRIKPRSPAMQADFLPSEPPGKPELTRNNSNFLFDNYTIIVLSVQFSSVQFSHSVMSDSLRPHELQHARPPCPSPTPGVHSNSCPSSWWCHLAISSSVVPFSSCPQHLSISVLICIIWITRERVHDSIWCIRALYYPCNLFEYLNLHQNIY